MNKKDLTRAEEVLLKLAGNLGLARLIKKTGILEKIFMESYERTPFTQLANLTGRPAMPVPLHKTGRGLPLGVQFMTARGEEGKLLQLAHLLEQSPLWIDIKQNPYFSKVMGVPTQKYSILFKSLLEIVC